MDTIYNIKKIKRYWKLLLKYHEDLNNSVWKIFTCFEHLMTTIDVVDYLINIDEELKQLILYIKIYCIH